MRRPIFLLAATVLFTAAACGSSAPTAMSGRLTSTGGPASGAPSSNAPASSGPAEASPSDAASLAPDDTVWLCKPGLAGNPCESSLDATVVEAGGASSVEPAAPAANPPIDCFYVYPTVSRQTTVNADLTIEEEERGVAIAQAARFSQVCHVYAPMYRQLTLAALARPSQITLASALVAYGDVYAAFRNYMARYNHGRPIVFIGHSQGAIMLIALLRSEVDTKPEVRRLLVSALLLGGNVTVPVGKSVGGDFASIPACSSATEIGCVVAYSSFDRTPAANAAFGRADSSLSLFTRTSTVPLAVLCVNPAAPGGTGNLEPYFPTAALDLFLGSAAPTPAVFTPFMTYPNLYSAHCATVGGATWLQVDRIGGASDRRPSVAPVASATSGLHILDVNIALGNLVDLVRSQAAAFR
ncbi:MAG: DUF3089 domain-containing protein [Candidatus Limnocylindrales bacterium]